MKLADLAVKAVDEDDGAVAAVEAHGAHLDISVECGECGDDGRHRGGGRGAEERGGARLIRENALPKEGISEVYRRTREQNAADSLPSEHATDSKPASMT
jgi:hypothetical protein